MIAGGVLGERAVRIQPTIWALRALKRNVVYRKELIQRFEQLRTMHSSGFPGCFGFAPGSAPPRISPTASFLLLSAELQEIGYEPGNPQRFFRERYNAAQFIQVKRPEGGFWPPEVEVYYVDEECRPIVGHIEQLNWHHVAGPLAIEALSKNPDLTGRMQAAAGWLNGALQMLAEFDPKSAMFQNHAYAEYGLTEPVFPTAYACIALSAFEGWLDKYEEIQEYVPVPPPFIEGTVIRKVGAAIIRSGRLLRTRKFGTDKLIIPGGGIERNEAELDALHREIAEELGVTVELAGGEPIGTYRARAAFEAGMDVEITLYQASLKGEPKPSSEIEEIIWYDPNDDPNILSLIIKDHILPSLKQKGFL